MINYWDGTAHFALQLSGIVLFCMQYVFFSISVFFCMQSVFLSQCQCPAITCRVVLYYYGLSMNVSFCHCPRLHALFLSLALSCPTKATWCVLWLWRDCAFLNVMLCVLFIQCYWSFHMQSFCHSPVLYHTYCVVCRILYLCQWPLLHAILVFLWKYDCVSVGNFFSIQSRSFLPLCPSPTSVLHYNLYDWISDYVFLSLPFLHMIQFVYMYLFNNMCSTVAVILLLLLLLLC